MSATPASVVADGSTTSSVDVTLLDSNGVPISGKTVTLSSSRGASDTISPSSGTSNASGRVTFTVRSLTLGTATLTATDTTDSLTLAQTASVAFVAGSVSAADSTLSASPSSVTANGVATSTVTVTLKDAYGHNISGKTVTLSSSRDETDTISPSSGTSDSNGVVTFTVSSTTAGTATLTATNTTDSITLSATPSVTFDPGPVSAGSSTVSASPTSVTANGTSTSTVTVTLKDAFANVISGHSVSLSSSRGATDTITPSSATTNASGVATFTVTSTTAGSSTYTATDSTASVTITQTAGVSFTPGPVSASVSTVGAAPTSVVADGTSTSTITVTLKDANGNVVSGKSVSISSSRGATDTISPSSATTNASGVATFTVKSSTTGSSTISATDVTDSLDITATASVTFTAVPVHAGNSSVTASSYAVEANGTSTTSITVTLRDASNNLLTGRTVSLSSSRGATDSITPPSGTSDAFGQVAFTVSSSTLGNAEFTATGDGVTLTQTATISFRSTPSTGMKLQVPVEMLDRALGSNASSQIADRSSTTIDTNAYNGTVSYAFEIVATNVHSTNAYSVELLGPANVSKATISIPAGTTAPRLYQTPFTPNTGSGIYKVRIAGTPLANDLVVHTARILIYQINATVTRIYIPLVNSNNNSPGTDGLGMAFQVNNTLYVAPTTQACHWKKSAHAFSTLAATNPWTFEALIRHATSGQGYAQLFNYDDGTAVAGTELSGGSSAPLQSVSFADNATNFLDAKRFEIRVRSSDTGAARLYKAGLWVKVADLTKAEVYYRVSHYGSTNALSLKQDFGRVWLDTSLYTNPSVFFEAIANVAGTSAYGYVKLRDCGATDSGATCSPISSGDLYFNGALVTNQRTGALTVTSGNRLIVELSTASTGHTIHNNCSLVVVGIQ